MRPESFLLLTHKVTTISFIKITRIILLNDETRFLPIFKSELKLEITVSLAFSQHKWFAGLSNKKIMNKLIYLHGQEGK